jgi:S1-C subfamily serine protease
MLRPIQIASSLLVAAAVLAMGPFARAEEAPRLMLLQPSDDHELIEPEARLPKMGFYSVFVHGRGARVTGLAFDGEAERIGLEVGDVIVGVNGQRLQSPHDWANIIHDIVHTHDDEVLLYGAQQSGGPQMRLKPTLKPLHEPIITLHIRDWRTGQIHLRKTNLRNWE